MAFYGILGSNDWGVCGLAAQNALKASQAVREMCVMVNAEDLYAIEPCY